MAETDAGAGGYNEKYTRVSRLLKLINVLIAIALATALAAAYWFAWRVLPQTSGSLALPIAAPATISRDALGVAHIRAASVEDAVFLQGYVTAQDRLWAMDMTRRKASGELSELVGPPAAETDRVARVLHLRKIAAQQARNLTPPDRAILAAYARGVNEFLRTHHGSLPVEFSILRYDPRPWSIVDTLAIGMEMSRTLSQTHLAELQKSLFLSTGDRGKVNQLFPVRTGNEVSVGSNAWVVSGKHTATGLPLLANDMHLEFTFPSTWYQVHLEAPGLNVTGVSLPGVPMVIVGHNESIAWGITNLHFDVMDIYAEKMDAAGRYEYQGRQEQARGERERIVVKGGQPLELTQFATRHGFTLGSEGGRLLALRWGAADPNLGFAFLALNQARDWPSFRQALARFTGPTSNFIYADVQGNIGYQAAGRLPVRDKSCDSSLPLDGAAGACEWQGWIPFDDLPSIFNPPSGRIISANQNPFPADYKYPVAGRFSANYRARQIESLLAAQPKHTVDGMLVIQKDVYSPFSHFLARELARVGAARGGDQTLREAVALLQAWYGQMEQGQSAPLIAQLAFENLRREVAVRAAPGQGQAYEAEIASEVVEKLLREKPKDWFPDYDALLLRTLVDAVQAGVRMQGKDVKRWDYSRNPQGFVLPHPVLNQLPLVGQYFQIGPVPMAGSPTTIKQTTRRLGPSMRFVADLSNWERSQSNITIGQSGQVFSRHFRDQWDAYYVGKSFPMPFKQVAASSTLSVTPR